MSDRFFIYLRHSHKIPASWSIKLPGLPITFLNGPGGRYYCIIINTIVNMRKPNSIIKTLVSAALCITFFMSCGEDDEIVSGNTNTGDENVETDDGNLPDITGYPVVGTNQTTFYGNLTAISEPGETDDFYGQDAQYIRNAPQYEDNGDGTVTDLVTGLMWSQSIDLDGDGDIDVNDKLTFEEASNGASSFSLGGYDDWRLPTIKELYSLILFSGLDVSDYEGTSTSDLVPFIDTDYFEFGYGDTDADERIIDAQYASSTQYVDYTMDGDETLFGVNFADGRIKGYGLVLHGAAKTFYVAYVRGNTTYGVNDFTDNGDGTITDEATGLMWMQGDNGEGITWKNALSYAENLTYAGYSDWRLPAIKELQSIVDYTRSPSTTSSPAIDELFDCTKITNEAGDDDYPYYWSGTTHASWGSTNEGKAAAYVCFGRAMGYMSEYGGWVDVHGAGAQRSDYKNGDPDDYPTGHGPQGDAVRMRNYVRCVRYAD